MTGTGIYAIVWASVIAVLLVVTRRRWLNFSCVGAYIVSFMVMNYVGLVLAAIGYQYMTRSLPIVSQDALMRAITIGNLGFVACLGGIRLVDMLIGAPPVYTNLCILPVNRNSPLGMRIGRVAILVATYVLLFAFLCRGELPQLARLVLSGDAVMLYSYRLYSADQGSFLTVWLTYDFLPYTAFCGMLVFFKMRTPACWLFVLAFLAAALGKVVLLHKEPVMVLVIQCCITWMILRHNASRSSQSDFDTETARPISVFRISGAVTAAFGVLTLLMWFSHPFASTHFSVVGQLRLAALMAFERIFGRVSNGYLYIADMVPTYFPHYGFNNSPLWARLTGGDFLAVNKSIFLVTHPGMSVGSIASDSIINFYGGFGFTGLVILSLVQGMLLAGIDRWISQRPATLGWLALLVFMMSFSFYLTETSLFGAALGFGGMSFVAHACLCNDWDEQSEGELDAADHEGSAPTALAA